MASALVYEREPDGVATMPQAGLPAVRAHRLRHALATELLDLRESLPEIAQVLRQRDLATTPVYAKVNHAALRELALPWPAAR